ncbi:DUF2207 domain-containing protein [Candidatus Beckwithbacteria bacterium]|nr:DUF2207 domain-containing protein [Candidatus Beckwithbacteria bacterium]
MKKIFYLFFAFIFLFLPSQVFAQNSLPLQVGTVDQIDSFKSKITINNDTSITIKETLEYETNLQKHGIYRYIPYRYNRNNLSYTAKIKNIQISYADGQTVPYQESYENGNVVLKIGDAEKTFTGKKTYLISYRVENALQRFEGYDELFWDITGEGWQIPVLSSQAIVSSPFANITKIDCFSGVVGGNDKLCLSSLEKNQAKFIYDHEINYGSNFTVLLALDQNSQIMFPSSTQLLMKTILDNWFLIIAIFPGILFSYLWFNKGRDFMFLSPNIYNMDEKAPKQRKPLFYSYRNAFHYEPIKALTPGEAGTILYERTDNQDIIAEIIDLARQKYLKIEQVEKKKFLGLGKGYDYKFTLLKTGESLPSHQQYLLTHIFNGKDEVKLEDLKGTFYTHMQTAKDKINQSVKDKKLFTTNPSTTRGIYIALAIVLSGVCGFASITLGAINFSPLPFLLAIPSVIIALLCAYNMPAKTAVGTNYYLQTTGLKKMIETGKWREEIHEKNLFIEEILPFAIALGVVKKLAKDMEQLNLQAPDYFSNTMMRNVFFYQFLNDFSQSASSTLSYNPSSSRMSGGSGFSGGSSGGGGGGGGGGSW